MKDIAKYESKRTSLVCVDTEIGFLVSAMGVLPNGELNDAHEMFSETYTDRDVAVKVYNRLRMVLSTCDLRNHYTTTAVLKGYAQEAVSA
jgi:hypothetical protein